MRQKAAALRSPVVVSLGSTFGAEASYESRAQRFRGPVATRKLWRGSGVRVCHSEKTKQGAGGLQDLRRIVHPVRLENRHIKQA